MKTKLMIAVETENCYEIFDNMGKAIAFAKKGRHKTAFIADFNKERIFREIGGWNYNDCNDTYSNLRGLKLKVVK